MPNEKGEKITVTREYIERLVELGELADKEIKSKEKYPQWVPHLLGYIKGSGEMLLKRK